MTRDATRTGRTLQTIRYMLVVCSATTAHIIDQPEKENNLQDNSVGDIQLFDEMSHPGIHETERGR